MKVKNKIIGNLLLVMSLVLIFLVIFDSSATDKLVVDILSDEIEAVDDIIAFYYEGDRYVFDRGTLCAYSNGNITICVLPEVWFDEHSVVLETDNRLFKLNLTN
jgi:hypothetical protein